MWNLAFAVNLAFASAAWFAASFGYPLIGVVAVVVFIDAALAFTGRAMPGAPEALSWPRPRSMAALEEELRRVTAERDALAEKNRAAGAGLAALSDSAVMIEENGRATLAGELHDTVAQTLLAARYSVLGGQDREQVADLIATADKELRNVIEHVSPLAESRTFSELADNLRDSMLRGYGLKVELDWPERDIDISRTKAIVAYRLVHESLHNIAKHAQVDTAHVRIEVEDAPDGNQLLIEIEDRGEGFDTTAARRGFGLSLLQARCEAIGSKVEIESTRGMGTTVRATIPVP